MDQDIDNDNNEYYLPIQTRSGQIIVNPNHFGQAYSIALGLLTCKCNASL